MQRNTEIGIPIRDVLTFYNGASCKVKMHGENGIFESIGKINYYDISEDVVVVTVSIADTDEIHYVSPENIELLLKDFYDISNEDFGKIIRANIGDDSGQYTLIYHEIQDSKDYRECTWMIDDILVATFRLSKDFILEMINHVDNTGKWICPPGHVIRMSCQLGYNPFFSHKYL